MGTKRDRSNYWVLGTLLGKELLPILPTLDLSRLLLLSVFCSAKLLSRKQRVEACLDRVADACPFSSSGD